jgi:PAS domain S-box-containing protein
LPLTDILEHLREGCQVIGFDYRYLYVNSAVCAQARTSREELLGRTMMEAYPGIDGTPMFAVLRRCMEERTPAEMENMFEFPDGSKGWHELRFAPVPAGVFILSLDITERKRAEQALEQAEARLQAAQRMESIGRLAGGVAHDFNNLLSVIISYTEFALEGVRPGDPLRSDLEEVEKAGHRAAALTRQLLAFSRKQVLEPEIVDLGAVLSNMASMLQRLLGEDLALRLVLAPDLGSVRVDPGQMEQVVMNLAVNARDAMPSGGHLTIETANVELDDACASQHLSVPPGPYVTLSVSDDGAGMSKETLGRIFEPFFTTKERGKGTGLGLSTVFGIVKQSGGGIWVYSELGRGTTFKVYLPRLLSTIDIATRIVRSPTRSTGGEAILLVEDEAAVRKAAERILAAAGYGVATASTAEEALRVEQGKRIHLLVTDVVLPGMTAGELVTRLRRDRPDLRVLFMSGYTDDAIVHHGVLDPGVRFINKPFNASDLTRKVREVLDEGDP